MMVNARQILTLTLCLPRIRSASSFVVKSSVRSTSVLYAEEQRSIGEVVQGLHGSKYQFTDPGINFEGQQFLEMSYSSGEQVEDNLEEEPPPNWALKLQEKVPSQSCPELKFDQEGGASVEIRNDEKSWEKYYAFIIGGGNPISVEPRVGMLAPRGGVSNYSDRALLKLKLSQTIQENAFLVVGTEAESWTYKLR